MKLHEKQVRYFNSTARFNVAHAGRRSGKTELFKRRCVLRAIAECEREDAWYIMGAPTHRQAKRIFWKDLKDLIPSKLKLSTSESEMTVRLYNGAEISVMGMDVPQRVEGRPIDGGGLDEFGNMRPQVFFEHIRPALAERGGWFDFIGVPEGRNHYYDLVLRAEDDKNAGWWKTHHWTSEEILPLYLGEQQAKLEIEAAKREMDDLTYRQEFLADFVTFEGRAYYAFEREKNCLPVDYNPSLPLVFCFDFNVSPGVCAIVQETNLGTCVVDEVWIEKSNTFKVCDELLKRYGKHKQHVYLYGDATGGARGSAKVKGSDWDLVRQKLKPVFTTNLKDRVPKANPKERVRVNALNSRCRSADGRVALYINEQRASHLVKDMEGVTLQEGSGGEIDKKSSPMLTHISDALGYYVVRRWPVKTRALTVSLEAA